MMEAVGRDLLYLYAFKCFSFLLFVNVCERKKNFFRVTAEWCVCGVEEAGLARQLVEACGRAAGASVQRYERKGTRDRAAK